MRIAIIGGTGLLGSNLLKLYSKYDVKSFSREQSYNIDKFKNFTIDFRYLEDELIKYFMDWKPDVIVNTVAIVNLQRCEDNYIEALEINCNVAKSVSIIARKYSSYFIHISTDHYFNDDKKFHSELDEVILLNNYAKTKYQAEKDILQIYNKSLIVRTNIIGFRRRTAKSFFEWLLDALENQEHIELYSNFYTSPISVNQLGNILLKCYEKKLYGIYNISAKEVINKYEFGIKTAKKFGYKTTNIDCVELNNLDNIIKRALTLGLDVLKIKNDLGIEMPTIDDVINSLYLEYGENNE